MTTYLQSIFKYVGHLFQLIGLYYGWLLIFQESYTKFGITKARFARLGHASTQTTRIYAIPSLEMLKEAMEKGIEADDCEALWKGHEDELAALCGLR
ncbi:MAG: hypothetical protein ACK5ML_11280 [Lachnospiraceae bacterium]